MRRHGRCAITGQIDYVGSTAGWLCRHVHGFIHVFVSRKYPEYLFPIHYSSYGNWYDIDLSYRRHRSSVGTLLGFSRACWQLVGLQATGNILQAILTAYGIAYLLALSMVFDWIHDAIRRLPHPLLLWNTA